MNGAATLYLPVLFCISSAFLSTPASAQRPLDWKKHRFKSHRVEFKTPGSWRVAINDTASQAYIECYSPDDQIYFFITSADNEKNSDPEIVLSYLKVTYTNSEFIREERLTINHIDFLFSSGMNKMNEIQTFIKLGVGVYKDRVYMVDSGYSRVNSDEDERLLTDIIESIKVYP